MTDRHAAYIVTLANDVRDDSDEAIITALSMVKGVLSVQPLVADWQLHVAEQRADVEWRNKVADLAFPKERS